MGGLKFLGANGGSMTGAVAALNYAVNMGAMISSNSWGCLNCYSAPLEKALQTASAKGHLFITAAGNDSKQVDGSTSSYPCNYNVDNLICVASTNRQQELSWFSNKSTYFVHVAAPGSDIYSTVNKDNGNYSGDYGMMSGTSMATPAVAGVASLLAGQGLYAEEIKQVILGTVQKTGYEALDGEIITGGLIDAAQALKYAKGMIPTTDQPNWTTPEPTNTPAPCSDFARWLGWC